MKNLRLCFATSFIFSVLFAQAQWAGVGNPAVPGSSAGATDITFSSSGTPYLYYYDNLNYVPVALKYNGTNWDSLGSGLSVTGGTSGGLASAFALAPDSTAYIACSDAGELIVLNCVSGVWSTSGNTGVQAYIEVAAAVDANNTPYVAYTKAPAQPTYFDSCIVIKYSGGSWTQVGAAFSAEGISITISNGVSYVLYSDSNNFCNVVSFNGSSWASVGTPAFSIQGVSGSAMQVSSNGTVYVAYSDTSNGFLSSNLSVVKSTGSSWTNIGNAQFTPGSIQTHHALALDSDGNVFVTFIASNGVSVMGNLGGSWFNVGATDFANTFSTNSSIALSPGGIPYAAFDTTAQSIATVEDYAGVINSIKAVQQATLQIYPNPADNILNLTLPNSESGQISLYDITGKRVMSYQQTEITNQRIDLSKVAAGIYMLEYRNAGTCLVAKVIKE